jgi:hypothetical protein
MAWSPDFGDYWADINPRIAVQDFAFETSTILYVIDTDGSVQKLPYTGTADWLYLGEGACITDCDYL